MGYKEINSLIAKCIRERNNPNATSKEFREVLIKREPSMLNALHIYYEFSYNEELDVYVYTFVRPYND